MRGNSFSKDSRFQSRFKFVTPGPGQQLSKAKLLKNYSVPEFNVNLSEHHNSPSVSFPKSPRKEYTPMTYHPDHSPYSLSTEKQENSTFKHIAKDESLMWTEKINAYNNSYKIPFKEVQKMKESPRATVGKASRVNFIINSIINTPGPGSYETQNKHRTGWNETQEQKYEKNQVHKKGYFDENLYQRVN